MAEQYEAKLQQSLQELRDQYEAQMRVNREEIELLYENKIKNLTSHAQRNSDAASTAIEELRQTRSGIDTLKQRINELEASTNALNSRIRYVFPTWIFLKFILRAKILIKKIKKKIFLF